MGQIFIAVGHGSDDRLHLQQLREGAAVMQELLQIRDSIVQNLRSNRFAVVSVPDELTLEQTVEWINLRSRSGDCALTLWTAPDRIRRRGATVYCIASNDQRRSQAEQLLQRYLRRVPQLPSRGVKPDTQTELGSLAFCRRLAIPSLFLELGALTDVQDQTILQTERQNAALGLAEGLAGWSRSLTDNPPISQIDLHVNGAYYDDKGLLMDGNAYVPIDLVNQLSVDLTADVQRREYGKVVYVRAADLRAFNLFTSWDSTSEALTLRSGLAVYPDQIDRIMGLGKTSEIQLIMFLKSHYPEGLNQIPDLPRLYREEAQLEGVNHDIAFAQMCLETDFLHSNTPHYNFGGLGDLYGNPEGASFPDALIGVRAHIQHLKAYATAEPLTQAIVDPRFGYIRRGVAPHIEQLSGRWSADLYYGQKIGAIVRRLYDSAGFL